MRRLLVNATVAVGVVLRLTLATVRAEEPVNAAEPSANAPAVEVVPTPLTGHRLFVGAGACAASGCHGGDKNSAAAWQSSYTVWATADKHALAYRVLYDELAHKIVQKLDRATDWKTTRP